MPGSNKGSEKTTDLLFVQRRGQGPEVLLLHGFGEDHSVWEGPAMELEKHFSLLIPDLPGTGLSNPIDDMSMDGMAQVLLAILPEHPIPVIGHSMGGYIALAMLEKFPDRLNALGLFHSTSYADTEEKKASRRKGIEFIQQHGAFEFLKTTIPNLFSPLSNQKMAAEIRDFIDRQSNSKAASLVSYYEAMMARPDRRHLLKEAHIPVLFLLGKYDMAVPFSDGLEQSLLPGISYIHILRRSGHMGMMEEAGSANTILKNYLIQVQSQQ